MTKSREGRSEAEQAEWEALLAEKKTPAEGRRVPSNVLSRPIKLPRMEPIKSQ